MYRIMQSPVASGETLADFAPDKRFRKSWVQGIRFDAPPPDPLELTWVATNEGGVRVSYYSHGPVLMTKRLVEALHRAGVDNIDTYPVIIRSPSVRGDCGDYVAVNIIGIIPAADMERSVVLDAPDGALMTVIFESLVIDESKAAGHLLFRLAESVSTVVIHEHVVRHLESLGGFGLTFLDPADYVG